MTKHRSPIEFLQAPVHAFGAFKSDGLSEVQQHTSQYYSQSSKKALPGATATSPTMDSYAMTPLRNLNVVYLQY